MTLSCDNFERLNAAEFFLRATACSTNTERATTPKLANLSFKFDIPHTAVFSRKRILLRPCNDPFFDFKNKENAVGGRAIPKHRLVTRRPVGLTMSTCVCVCVCARVCLICQSESGCPASVGATQ